MSSNPIDPEFLHLAREWAGSAMSPENLRPIPGGAIAAARIILDLPEPAPLTMDKITWSDAEHHLAEADAGPHGNVVMLEPYRSKYGRFIRLLMPDSPHQNKVDGMAASGLTPTGRKMKLVPAEWGGAARCLIVSQAPQNPTLSRDRTRKETLTVRRNPRTCRKMKRG